MFRCLAVGLAVLVTILFAGESFAQCNHGGQGGGGMRGGGMGGGGMGGGMMSGGMGGGMQGGMCQGGGMGQGMMAGQMGSPAGAQMAGLNQVTSQLRQLAMQEAYKDAMYRMASARRYQQHVAVRSQIAAQNRAKEEERREQNRARIAAGSPSVSGPLLATINGERR